MNSNNTLDRLEALRTELAEMIDGSLPSNEGRELEIAVELIQFQQRRIESLTRRVDHLMGMNADIVEQGRTAHLRGEYLRSEIHAMMLALTPDDGFFNA